jgi:predicted transcriptional regulator
MIFRLSQKLAKKLKSPLPNSAPADPNPFADWSAHLFTADKTQYLILTNTPSLYSTVIYGRGILNDSQFLDRALSLIREYMVADGQEFIFWTGVHRLWINCGGSAGHQFVRALDIHEGTREARQWAVSLSKADDARQALRNHADAAKEQSKVETLKRERARMLNAMLPYPAGETKTTIGERAGLNTGRMRSCVSSALDDGMIEACTVTKNSKPFDAYKLTNYGRKWRYCNKLWIGFVLGGGFLGLGC